ncbi:MAG TPA: VOC family protein [Gemmataceae bacterium]|nr:VOC family protein [Gemmataceae bacterium]
MIITVEPVVLFIPDLEAAVAWYRAVLGVEPEVILERTALFRTARGGELLLVYGEGERHSGAAVLMCDDLDSALAAWRQWVGVVELECLGPDWPVRLVVLRDPGDNCLVVLDAASNERQRPRTVSVSAGIS